MTRLRCPNRIRIALLALGLVATMGSGSAAFAAEAHAARVGPAPGSQPLQLVLPLKARDGALGRFARAVSTPGSPLYGQYEPVATLARRFGAAPDARARVINFLRAHGARNVSVDKTGLLAEATVTVSRAEALFETPLAQFHADDGRRFVAPAAAVTVPAALRGLVDGVLGLDTRPLAGTPQPLRSPAHAPAPRASARARVAALGPLGPVPSDYDPATGTPSGCAAGVRTGGFTPNQYLNAYDYSPLRSAHLGGEGERIALIEIDGYKYSDLQTFSQCFNLDIPAINTYDSGLPGPLPPGGEATLDLDILDAVAPDLAAIDVFESQSDSASLVRAFAQALSTPKVKPQVISNSIGLCEAQSDGASIQASEREFQMIAAAGTTVVSAAGDNGSADCTDENSNDIDQLAVDYPASSPEVTGVGGTNLTLTPANQISDQVVWNDGGDRPGLGGGGGFSDLFARPAYQSGVVPSDHRAVPDVSMLADTLPGYAVYCTALDPTCVSGANPDPWAPGSGTSAAAPLLAGGIALVDEDLHRHGRSFVGELNPLLYHLGASSASGGVFSDVTQGSNDVGPYIGTGSPLGCCGAATGFDEASGWGSVDLAHFDQSVQQLLPVIPTASLTIAPHQKPVHGHQIRGTLSCPDACRASGIVIVRIAGRTSFQVDARIYTLRAGAKQPIALRFSPRQEGKLRVALARGQRIFAQPYGMLFDAKNNVTKTITGTSFRITG
ncbi:MAG: S53 family peptidase [Solirubrobacteraceae bacterium]